jgi:hypothetical protein
MLPRRNWRAARSKWILSGRPEKLLLLEEEVTRPIFAAAYALALLDVKEIRLFEASHF